MVGNLRGVVGFTQAECQEISRLHKFASDVTAAHDSSSGKNMPVPDPAQLGRDIDAMKNVIVGIKKRR